MNFVHVQKGVYIDVNEEIAWSQWVTKKEKRMIKSEEKEIVITVKEETKGTIGYLLDNFHDQIQDTGFIPLTYGISLNTTRMSKRE